MSPHTASDARHILASGEAYLGIELGSTRIKACAIDGRGTVLATGGSDWENELVDGHWTYSLDAVWEGLRSAYAALLAQCGDDYGLMPTRFAAMGVSAMMHGYLAFDSDEELLVPFRTWRDTYTGEASRQLTELFGVNVPLRWSVSHYWQNVLDGAEHVHRVDFLTTLAGYVHWQLTGQKVLGIGDAVGMFPIDAATGTYHARMVRDFDDLAASHDVCGSIVRRLPSVLRAGERGGVLTPEGAKRLDSTGTLEPGITLCPPEGDAGTGMVATNSVKPRTGNVSVGTSIFAMIVLERDLAGLHTEIDPVTTPAGDPVAMVHCNNGAAEIATWVDLFAEVHAALGGTTPKGKIYDTLLTAASGAPKDGGGVLAYNNLSGEPVVGLTEGRPLVVRRPDARLNMATFMRSQLHAVFSALALGMRSLEEEGVAIDSLYAHGGLFKTPLAVQRLLAAAVNTPIAVGEAAGEGGAWGIALLAAYTTLAPKMPLTQYLDDIVFAGTDRCLVDPDPADVEGFASYLEAYKAGLALQVPAVAAVLEPSPNRSAN